MKETTREMWLRELAIRKARIRGNPVGQCVAGQLLKALATVKTGRTTTIVEPRDPAALAKIAQRGEEIAEIARVLNGQPPRSAANEK